MLIISCLIMTNCGDKPSEKVLTKIEQGSIDQEKLIEEKDHEMLDVNNEIKESVPNSSSEEKSVTEAPISSNVTTVSNPISSNESKIKDKESKKDIVSASSNTVVEEVKSEDVEPSIIAKDQALSDLEQKQTSEVDIEKPKGKSIEVPAVKNQEEQKEEIKNVVNAQTAFSHESWNAILKANVSGGGKVNYVGIKSNISELDNYLELLSQNTPLSSWSKNKTKAYWINAYNAFTIKLIIDNYPVGSITDLHGGKPWDKKWINLGSKTYSLNDIEHVILRPTYNDPRIHFAVNCAAKSCPKVWNNAWTESNIESALDKLTREFVTNNSANQISEKSVNLSKIFEWYKEDFGNLIDFLNQYSTTKISSNAKVAFNDYNWKLNS